MIESTVSLSATFRSAFDKRVAAAASDVGKAENLISSFEQHLKSGESLGAADVADARKLVSDLNMTGSAMALEGLNSNMSDDELQTSITKVERAAERLTGVLARIR